MAKIRFINRENEINAIEKGIFNWGSNTIICIQGVGGIGKTRFLQNVYEKFSNNEEFITPRTIDFDDYSIQDSESLSTAIATSIDKEHFKPFLDSLRNYKKQEVADIDSNKLNEIRQDVDNTFVANFNSLSINRRIIILMDTTDSIDSNSDTWNYLHYFFKGLNNFLLLIAGRRIDLFYNKLIDHQANQIISLISLDPLDDDSIREYLQIKQDIIHISISQRMVDFILKIVKGKPILIDLVIEWIHQPDFRYAIAENNFASLHSLFYDKNDSPDRWKKIELQLVERFFNVRTAIDRFILMISHVYPVDIDLTADLLHLSYKDAEDLIKKASDKVYVKSLPNGQVSVHDEVRAFIKQLWDDYDSDFIRRKNYSSRAVKSLDKKIDALDKKIVTSRLIDPVNINLENEQYLAEKSIYEFRKLEHSLYYDVDKGVKLFVNLFDQPSKKYSHSYKRKLLNIIKNRLYTIGESDNNLICIKEAKYWFYLGDFTKSETKLTYILRKEGVSAEHEIEALILLGNNEVRLGSKNALKNFEKAVEISRNNNLDIWLMRSLNALGWQHRIRWNLVEALKNYGKALEISMKYKQKHDEALILNNMAFVHGIRRNTIEAEELCDQALEIWKNLKDISGIGAVYEVYGVTYCRSGNFEQAYIYLQRAINIFESIEDIDWLSRVYFRRGFTYWMEGKYDKAYNDLSKAHTYGIRKDMPGILHLLSHIAEDRGNIEEAQKLMERSYDMSKEVADGYYECSSLGDLIKISCIKNELNKLEDYDKVYEQYKKNWGDTDFSNVKGRLLKYLGDLALQADPNNIARAAHYYSQAFPSLVQEPYRRHYINMQFKSLNQLLEDLDVSPENISLLGSILYTSFESHSIVHAEAFRFIFDWIGRGQKNNAN